MNLEKIKTYATEGVHTSKGFLQEFKEFAMRGNVIDLAVGVIIGGAFGKITSSIVSDIAMPILGIIIGGVDVSTLTFKFQNAEITYGKFLQATLDFLIIAFVIFMFIKVVNRFHKKKQEEAKPATPPRQEVLLEEIRDLLKNTN